MHTVHDHGRGLTVRFIYLYGIWSLRQRSLSLLERSLRRFIKSLRADPVPRMHSSKRSFMSDVLRKLCVFWRLTGFRFWPLYSKLGMQIFNTCNIWCTRCGVCDRVQLNENCFILELNKWQINKRFQFELYRSKTLLSKFFKIHTKHDNKCRVFSELSDDLFFVGSGENEYRRLPEMA